MRFRIFALTSLLAASTVWSGCAGSGQVKKTPSETNVLGIVKVEEGSYEHTGPSTIAIKTDELFADSNYSGKKVELLWGLITIKDY